MGNDFTFLIANETSSIVLRSQSLTEEGRMPTCKRRPVLAAAALLGLPASALAANIVSFLPSSDPGGLVVGDVLTFVVSVDGIAPPVPALWDVFAVAVRARGPDDFNFFSGGCSDLTGLSNAQFFDCGPASDWVYWAWHPPFSSADTRTLAGNLLSFTVLFDQPGRYYVYLDVAQALFVNPNSIVTLSSANHDLASAIVINVSEAAVAATLSGFYPPVDPPSIATNLAKAGQTIPLKFYAESADGPILDLTEVRVAIAHVDCNDIDTAVDVVESYSSINGEALQNLGGGSYQYNWKTAKGKIDCSVVTLSLPDAYEADSLIATFRFRK